MPRKPGRKLIRRNKPKVSILGLQPAAIKSLTRVPGVLTGKRPIKRNGYPKKPNLKLKQILKKRTLPQKPLKK